MKRILGALVMVAACGRPVEIDRPIQPLKVEQPQQPEKPAVTHETPKGLATFTKTVSDVTTPIELELNDQTVFCTALGYGATFLKVSIPQLDQLAHFNHRVEGTNLPCAAVGECSAEMGPDNILQGHPGVEPVSVRVVLVANLERDWDQGTCRRQLVEDVSAVVRGVPLHHHVEGEWEEVGFEQCF